ncbi:hypothetical protein EMIHUDRAFT_199519 [Emiliania huxleyi CCMP1516]|uniref:RING-type E3 ubiquitin transferase n=2 Tax=Emiliania huxleyi TaxID=2903 RepID=A0A0D3KZR7_EMIH1|nr:hypothetical protein EMIHUDRAFT_199519 [Emiliania huxleyi CCMP1516]EOD41252.1 hypothetical protein EMIHUDRAFT_199519 [Emiliania huxleyi CCMP1516]|eukprot:XP_005793681.1 hypothetical protein EMIHUDRAFT_199519 [Emiliania huxleyi CCMP1516]
MSEGLKRRPSSSDLFDCNICLDTATEPVITMCGHLYCWPCIYKWLELRRESDGAFCPICKAEISSDRMIPFNASAVGDEPGGEQLSPEQVQQAFLSRLLLLLGSFVILCLLLF